MRCWSSTPSAFTVFPTSQSADRYLYGSDDETGSRRGGDKPRDSQHSNPSIYCRYRGKSCHNARAVKIDGSLHSMCADHRQAANQNQRKADERKRKTHRLETPELVPVGLPGGFHTKRPLPSRREENASLNLSDIDDVLSLVAETVDQDMTVDASSPQDGAQVWV